ncbi:hypothetical protein HZA57_02580, partial [Candidatus Poribacteria bacterium]|nr:hypothetical protein [Candidatus Poribacteria bacterium]
MTANDSPQSQSSDDTLAKRKDLSALLWGEPESPGEGDVAAQRRVTRRSCSFPGLLHVLLPEVTFRPQQLAVRVIDISPLGARLQTRQLTGDLAQLIRTQTRHARLDALVPARRKLRVSGRIAWTMHRASVSSIGINFEQPLDDVDALFEPHMDSAGDYEEFNLPAPILDSFPTVTGKPMFPFTGRADLADTIVVSVGLLQFHERIVDGRFRVEVPLAP